MGPALGYATAIAFGICVIATVVCTVLINIALREGVSKIEVQKAGLRFHGHRSEFLEPWAVPIVFRLELVAVIALVLFTLLGGIWIAYYRLFQPPL